MRKILLISSMTLMTCGVAIAQDNDDKKMPMHKDGGAGMMHMMHDADANKDGVITREEVASAKKARFAMIDADGDGAISKVEMKVHHEEMMAKRDTKMAEHKEKMAEHMEKMKAGKESKMSDHFAKMDKDGDGAVKFDEFGHSGEKDMFARLDADGDGRITEEERKAGGKHKRMKKMKKSD